MKKTHGVVFQKKWSGTQSVAYAVKCSILEFLEDRQGINLTTITTKDTFVKGTTHFRFSNKTAKGHFST